MNILKVYPYYPPAYEYGGALRVVHSTASALVDRGHEVSVYTTDTKGSEGRIDADDPTTVDGVTVRYFPNVSNALTRRGHVPTPIGLRSALAQRVSEFDVVHIHGFPHILAWLAARAARKQDVPYVLTPHGTINRPGDSRTRLKRLFTLLFGRSILDGAARIIALTEDERSRLEAAGISSEKLVRVPNAIDPSDLSTPIDDAEFRRRRGFSDAWIIAFVGRLHPVKGLDLLVDVAASFQDVKIQGRPVEFCIVGPDDGAGESTREAIAERNLSNVSVLGYVSEDEKNAALSAADVYVLPSRGEGQPMSVLEACAVGTPVVISEHCSLPSVREAGAGQIVQADTESVYDALRDMLCDNSVRQQMSTNAEELVATEFSWSGVAAQLEELYRTVQ